MDKYTKDNSLNQRNPSLAISLIPVLILLGALVSLIIFVDTDAISEYSPLILLGAACTALGLSWLSGTCDGQRLRQGMMRSARQISPALPLLVLISMVTATWMYSGVVPLLIDYGLRVLNPTFFLVIACAVCSAISVLTGSSWTTIATIGVAFMGIGSVMGFSPGWIAGAIISGAYFGDKISPLSDTTVIASSSCGVDLFAHIRYMMLTSGPSMIIALAVFGIAGAVNAPDAATTSTAEAALIGMLENTFNITPWLLVIPLITAILIARKVNTLITLAVSSVLGFSGVFAFQSQLLTTITSDGVLGLIWSETTLHTANAELNSLLTTGGILGMIPTLELVTCAMIFGGVMIGTGMLGTIAGAFTHRLTHRRSIVGATVASGLVLNSLTADQYLSIIIGSNMYRDVYSRFHLQPRLLSRTLEDSISVTSVLIPWNSCGVTQSTVLGVATLTYLPYCVFNYLSPIMSMVMVTIGFRIHQHHHHTEHRKPR
jgi:NhaC family Na+:H+ antiporter